MGVMAAVFGYVPKAIMGIQSIETGVFGGIVVGSIAGWLFNKYYRIQLPPYLGFFAGKRFVPIATALACIVAGVILSIVWRRSGVRSTSSRGGGRGQSRPRLSAVGSWSGRCCRRAPSHLDVPFFLKSGTTSNPIASRDPWRDPSLYGWSPTPQPGGRVSVQDVWLPPRDRDLAQRQSPNRARSRHMTRGLTSFLTGITEPIEFSFLFVAPLLYAIHALLAAVAYFTCIELGIKHGMTFSHGFIDFVVLFNRSTHGLWFLVLGPIWALIYYGLFRGVIRRFDLKTPGREVEADLDGGAAEPAASAGGLAGDLVAAFGGRANIQTRSLHHGSACARRSGASQSRSSEGARPPPASSRSATTAGDLRDAVGEPEEATRGLPALTGADRRRRGAAIAATVARSLRAVRNRDVSRRGVGCRSARRRGQHHLGGAVCADARPGEGERPVARQ